MQFFVLIGQKEYHVLSLLSICSRHTFNIKLNLLLIFCDFYDLFELFKTYFTFFIHKILSYDPPQYFKFQIFWNENGLIKSSK